MGLEDGATNRGDHRRSIERAQGGALDLGGDADLLDPVDAQREGGAGARLERRMTQLGGPLDVLRVVILPAHDDDILDATGDVELAVLEEAEITRAQPRTGAIGLAGPHALGRALGLPPVARRDMRAAQPDFPHGGGRAGLE